MYANSLNNKIIHPIRAFSFYFSANLYAVFFFGFRKEKHRNKSS